MFNKKAVESVSSVPKSYHANLALNLTALWWKVFNPSLKSINKSNICTNNDFIYINISFILINISLIYTFQRRGEKYAPKRRHFLTYTSPITAIGKAIT